MTSSAARRIAALALFALLTVLPTSPAAAAGTCAFTGTMSTGGLRLGTPLSTVPWSFSSELDTCLVAPSRLEVASSGNVAGYGAFTGSCGAWVGNGTLTVGGHSSFGSLVLVGTTGAFIGTQIFPGPTVVATFTALALPSAVEQVPCVTELATNSLIIGVAHAI